MKSYIFIPLYNVNIEEAILDCDFGDFKFISYETFNNKNEQIILNQISIDFLSELKEDIRQPQVGELYSRQHAKYILVKECNLNYPKDVNNQEEKLKFDEEVREVKRFFDKFVLTARLISNGRLQVHKGYIFSSLYYSCFQLHTSTSIEHISPYFYSETWLPEGYYEINKLTLDSIINNLTLLDVLDNQKLSIPILYFTHYYNATNLFDRIIKLAIILECTMLANSRDELKYRLNLRICNFLQENVSDILSIFYDMRSSIVHCGDISNELYKKIKNIMENKYDNNIEALFYFLQEKIEPIIRKVLFKSLDLFSNSTEIKNYNQLAKKIDSQIISNIAL